MTIDENSLSSDINGPFPLEECCHVIAVLCPEWIRSGSGLIGVQSKRIAAPVSV